jgi:CHAT domain-containing protein/tetratricopeptide (TPR) repeat protein
MARGAVVALAALLSLQITLASHATAADAGLDSVRAAIARHDTVTARTRAGAWVTVMEAAGDSALVAVDSLVPQLRESGAYAIERALLARQLAARQRVLPAGDARSARSASRLGFACYRMNDHAAAAAAWRTSLAILDAAATRNDSLIVHTRKLLADAERLRGDYAAAESLLVRSIAQSEARLRQDAQHATLLNNLGALYWDEGRFDEAETLYRDALRLSAQDPKAPPARVATAHLNLGVLLRDQGRDAEATPHLETALAIAREAIPVGDPRRVLFLNEAARLHMENGRTDAAIALWEEALGVLDALAAPHPVYRAQVLYDLGRAHVQRGRLDRAEARLREARALQEAAFAGTNPELGMTLAALADVRARRGGMRDAEALSLSSRALELLADSPVAPDVRADAFGLRARLQRARGRPQAARADMARALAVVEEIRPRRGALDAARTELVSRYADFYDDLIAWHHDAGAGELALDVAERRRARVLRDRLAAARIDFRRDVPPEILAPLERRERDARVHLQEVRADLTAARTSYTANDRDALARIRALERELSEALRAQQALEAEIRSHSPSWRRALHGSASALSARRIQDALLPAGTSLVEYHVGARRSFVFVVPPAPGAVLVRELQVDPATARTAGIATGAVSDSLLGVLIATAFAPSTAADGIVQRRVSGVAPASPDTVPVVPALPASRLHALWTILVPPAIESRLRSAKEIVIIPDGPLHALPFEALVVQDGATDAARAYWLDRGPPVRYAHSIATLFDLAAREAKTARGAEPLLTVSDPAFAPAPAAAAAPAPSAPAVAPASKSSLPVTRAAAGRVVFPRLPATARESAALRAAFPDERVVTLQGEAATESQFKRLAPASRIVHVATHGVAEGERDAMLAALLFAPEPGSDPSRDDGWLHLFEIYDLDLDCELAVLSACDTEAGPRVRGEGTFALSRGFLVAGAQRTVASLWPVADESTAELMTAFMSAVAAAESDGGGRPDYAKLLRDAKLRLRRDPRWSAPSFWAAFILAGVR